MRLSLHFNRVSEWPALAGLESTLERAARMTLGSAGPVSGEASFTFVSRAEIRALNRHYLDHDRPTDVISFDLGEGGSLLGDVYISPEEAAQSAEDDHEELHTELLRLVIHGALHLLGFDHPEGAGRESSEMFGLQEELLQALQGD
jgi:probable rRNA maturation factor